MQSDDKQRFLMQSMAMLWVVWNHSDTRRSMPERSCSRQGIEQERFGIIRIIRYLETRICKSLRGKLRGKFRGKSSDEALPGKDLVFIPGGLSYSGRLQLSF